MDRAYWADTTVPLVDDAMNTTHIPLCLIVGFLGSGKTSFLKHIAHQFPNKQIAFVVNEFSPVDADGMTMQQEHDKVICLPGGSVFCRCLAGQFIQTLKDLPALLKLPHCDGVVVEASGIADPSIAPQMLHESGLDTLYTLSRIIAVVDPGNIADLLKRLPNTKSQLLAADTILINKTDLYPQGKIDAAISLIRSIKGKAIIESVRYCQITLELFESKSCLQASGDYAACADPNFATATAQCHAPVDVDRLLRAIDSLKQELYRAKGFLKSETGATYLDWTPASHSRFELPSHKGPYGFTLIGLGSKAPAINALASRVQSGAFNKC